MTTTDQPAYDRAEYDAKRRDASFTKDARSAIRLPPWVDDTQLSRAVADVHRCDLWSAK